jgi:hypothetical protein
MPTMRKSLTANAVDCSIPCGKHWPVPRDFFFFCPSQYSNVEYRSGIKIRSSDGLLGGLM